MAYHDELLSQAFDLLGKEHTSLTQADLRRSVSAAYYALFHLLISETVTHWDHLGSRGALGRLFEHSLMRKVSRRIAYPKQYPFVGEDPAVAHRLRQVAQCFVELQDVRHIADYDNTTVWTQSDALREVETAFQAFITWQSIRHEKIAQDYLVSLLIKPRD
jgi:hypothetical protein